MFNYTLRTKIILIVLLLVLLFLVYIISQYGQSRSDDIQLVSQLQSLAIGLEKHYDRFQAYPTTKKIAVENIDIITENGINNNGDIVYYRTAADWPRSAVLASNGQSYAIEFSLENSWSVWQAKGGQSCFLRNALVWGCHNQ